jgi:mannosyltransferase OCH1-like enzyme
MSSSSIPKIIFQTFKTENLSPQFQAIVNTWKEKNPNYEYRFFNDSDCDAFIRANFDERIYKAYKRIIPGAYKADMWRYCVLYVYGGVYADIDTICMNPIDNFLKPGVDFMTVIDANTGIEKYTLFNTFIASVPKFSALLDCIHQIVQHIEQFVFHAYKSDFSGPGLLGKKINRYLNRQENASYVEKEGLHNNVYLLHFEPQTEYVKDANNGSILLQNKNGNPTIQQLYNRECQDAKIISWLTSRPF